MRKTQGFTDLHAHFVYGVDDGARTAEDMRAMLDAAHRNGITALYGTSHRTPGMQHFPESLYREHLSEAEAYCREKKYPIKLYPGAEHLYTPAMRNFLEREPLQTLGKSEYVLIEFVPDIAYEEILEAIELVLESGYTPILAHIERYGCLYHGARAARIKEEYDVRFQVNCGTVIKGMGFWKTRTMHKWLKDELIDCISSDMHNCRERRNRMREAYDALGTLCGEAYRHRLLHWQP